MKIGIANDHHGIEINQKLTKYLTDLGYDVYNYGPDTTDPVDYPIYAFKLAEAVAHKDLDFGIVICNTGIGVCIACNKVKGIRCAKVNDEWEAKMTRQDNDANVLALSSRLSIDNMQKIVSVFLNTPFSNEDRHQRRIDLINNYNG